MRPIFLLDGITSSKGDAGNWRQENEGGREMRANDADLYDPHAFVEGYISDKEPLLTGST